MNIRPKKIPKFQGGNNMWYSGITDYDPTKYITIYDISRLVDGDMSDTKLSPWKSNIQGYDKGRYQPTSGYGDFGVNKGHYNYTIGVENQPYYQEFGNNILNSEGTNFTDAGLAWAKAVDALLPPGSKASFFDENGNIRGFWKNQYNDVHGRPAKVYDNLKDYVNAVRNDQILGARHNVFLKKGTRYFYTDNEGNRHWVDPEVAKNYEISKDPSEQGWENTTYWTDYELTGPKNNPPSQTTRLSNDWWNNPTLTYPNGNQFEYKPTFDVKPKSQVEASGKKGEVPAEKEDDETKGWNWKAIGNGLKQQLPNIIAGARLAGDIWNNNRVAEITLKGMRPDLKQTYYTYSQVKGDEAGKQQYYTKAAQSETRAKRAITSNMDTQLAYQNEAKAIGDQLRQQGDIIDNNEIRRTSEMSDQHQYANTQRATEVANYNIAALNAYNKLVHDVKAGQQSANWTSVSNALLTWESRQRQKAAQREEELRQAKLLQFQSDLETDEHILAFNDQWEKARTKGDYTEMSNIARKKQQYIRQKQIERLLYAKSGTKITRKSKDDLLYKTAKDNADHYRKMVKLTSDANNRKRIKIEKLTSHPKGRTRRYQQGGVAPFTIWRPATVGGETTTSTETSTSSSRAASSKDSEKSEMLDMVKELFKQVAGKGLPSDANAVYTSMRDFLAQAEFFGNEMSTSDIASMYLQQMQYLNSLKYFQDDYDKAKAKVDANDALNEYAVNAQGKYIAQNVETKKIEAVRLEQLRSGEFAPLTNGQILQMRATLPKYAFDQTGLLDVVSNGIGMSKVAQHIKSIVPAIKSNQIKEDSYVSNKLSRGIEALQQAPPGEYTHTITQKSNLEQAQYALNYIKGVLPRNMRAVLEVNAAEQGVTANQLIANLIGSETELDQSSEWSGGPGKSKNGSGNGSGDGIDDDKIVTNPLLAMQRGMGGTPIRYNIITRDSNTRMSVNGVSYSALPKVDDDMSIDKMLSTSGIDGILDSKYGITFGDQQVNPEDLKDIMYSNTGGAVVTLPCKIVNGHKQVNLEIKDLYEEAESVALQKVNGNRESPQYATALAKELQNRHLDYLLNSNGLPNKDMFGQFLVVEAYTTDNIKLNKNSQYIERVREPDERLEKRMSQALSTDDKKSNYGIDVKDKWLLFEWGYNDIYRGTMFIPLNQNPNSAMNSWGNSSLKIDQQQDLEELYQISNKSANYNSDNSLN